MFFRILFIMALSVSFSVFSMTDLSLSPGTVAHAGGDGGNNTDSKPKKERKASKPKETEAQKKARIKEGLALVKSLKQDLLKGAKKDKLRSVMRDPNELRYLWQAIDKAFKLLEGTKHQHDPSEVTNLLNQMTRRGQDEELRENAKNVKFGMKASRLEWDAEDIGHELQKVPDSDVREKARLQNKYERARRWYHQAARKIDEPLRSQVFQPMPEEPMGTRPANFN